MSLKGFHIVFITVAVFLCVGLGVWGTRTYSALSEVTALTVGISGYGLAILLIVYGVKTFIKLRSL